MASRECDGWRGIVESYAAGDALDAAAASRMALLETQLTEHKALTAQYASVVRGTPPTSGALRRAPRSSRQQGQTRRQRPRRRTQRAAKRRRANERVSPSRWRPTTRAAPSQKCATRRWRRQPAHSTWPSCRWLSLSLFWRSVHASPLTQVLRMVDNPLAQARRRLAEQRSGAAQRPRVNEALLATPRGHVYPVTPGGTIDADKRVQRLKEVFKAKIGAFREAVHVLFGYRMDMTDSQCRLLSQVRRRENYY